MLMIKKYSALAFVLIGFALSAIGQDTLHASASFGSPGKHYNSTKVVTDKGGVVKVEKADTEMCVHHNDVIVREDTLGHALQIIPGVIENDTNLRHQLTIKINPGLLFTEQGLMLQYNFKNNFGIELGYGINEDNSGNNGFHTYDGSGYTIRWGMLQYLDIWKHWYFSLQGFYRYYGNINAVAEDAEGFTQGIDDEVINPLRSNLNNVTAGDGSQVDVYAASASVICFDAVAGYQYRHKHFVLDIFAGAGSRTKNIKLHLDGYYINAIGTTDQTEIPYSTIESKAVSYTYPDVKLGFTLGYRFY